ncbi:MAG: glycoside hydrolase family 2 protein, partial [Calditrichaeota bacterium]|nr:glycoside hydrolase family 2 protein [Calditrichota bacterium]
ENRLRVYFHSPIKTALIDYKKSKYVFPAGNDQAKQQVSIFTRKAPYHYGWDWGPRFVTSGIWRPVSIRSWNEARILETHISQYHQDDGSVQLKVVPVIEADRNSQSITVAFELKNAHEQQSVTKVINLKSGLNTDTLVLMIRSPKLWWSNGLGKANMYQTLSKLIKNGTVISSKESRIGLRKIELVQETDSIGKSFYFRLNGIPVYMKGANYIPSDNFLNRVDRSRYESIFASVVAANMNMLRVWGGGIYENDKFYDLADQNGILIWQDFMFSTSMYPGNQEFLDNVKAEAIENVQRLHHHPSIAVWNGNNEMYQAWHRWGWQKAFKYSAADSTEIWATYKTIFHGILADAVHNYSQSDYWPSSPMGADTTISNLLNGDVHYWGVWHAEEPFENYNDNVGRFNSEFGFQSFPEFKTVKSYTDSTDWRIDSKVMLAHQRHPRGNQLIRTYMKRQFKTPKDFQSLLYVGQLLQASGIRTAIEAQRRMMPRSMGSLYWQLNDCWPVASWSGIDYYGRWKALHYVVKKAYEPLLLAPHLDDDQLNVYIVSDYLQAIPANLNMRLLDFHGNEHWSTTIDMVVEANTSQLYQSIPLELMPVKKHESVLELKLTGENGDIQRRLIYFAKEKDLKLEQVEIEPHISEVEDHFRIVIKSDKLAKNVYLSSDADGFFSDNFID